MEILSNEVDLTAVRLQAPRFVCAARRVTRACVYLGLGVLAILSVSVGGFLFVLARGPIGFDWLTPSSSSRWTSFTPIDTILGWKASCSRARTTGRRSPPRD